MLFRHFYGSKSKNHWSLVALIYGTYNILVGILCMYLKPQPTPLHHKANLRETVTSAGRCPDGSFLDTKIDFPSLFCSLPRREDPSWRFTVVWKAPSHRLPLPQNKHNKKTTPPTPITIHQADKYSSSGYNHHNNKQKSTKQTIQRLTLQVDRSLDSRLRTSAASDWKQIAARALFAINNY